MPRQLMKKAGLALVKSFRVKRFGEIIKLVIQVMADLVQQRPQKGPESHDLAPLRSAHPDRDNGRGASLRRHVQSLKLAPGCMRSDVKHVHPNRRRLKAGCDAGCKFSAESFGHCSVLVLERR